MLKILLMGHNHYKSLGLSHLISNQKCEKYESEVCFLLPSIDKNKEVADIIFYDSLVRVNVKKTKRIIHNELDRTENIGRTAINIPFFTKGKNIKEINIKIEKILSIANFKSDVVLKKEGFAWFLGLEPQTQLSDIENKIMMLIGMGYDLEEISLILNRAKKTICTHYRKASHKLGALNWTEFHRYASLVAVYKDSTNNTLCF